MPVHVKSMSIARLVSVLIDSVVPIGALIPIVIHVKLEAVSSARGDVLRLAHAVARIMDVVSLVALSQ